MPGQSPDPSATSESNVQASPPSLRVPDTVFRDLLAAADRVNRYHQAARSPRPS